MNKNLYIVFNLFVFVLAFCLDAKNVPLHISSTKPRKLNLDRFEDGKSNRGIVSSIKRAALKLQMRVSKIFNLTRKKAAKRAEMCKKLLNISLRKSSLERTPSNAWTSTNDDLQMALSYMSKDSGYWQFECENHGIEVWKTDNPLCPNADDKKWVCIKANAVINVPHNVLKEILLDSSKVQVFNKFSLGRDDKIILNKQSKIVWNRTKIPFKSKPFDFCTLIQEYHDPETGMIVITSKAVEHPEIPQYPGYVRSYVIFGLNALIPSPENPNMTQYISVLQVKHTGVHHKLAACQATQGTINYIKQLREIAPKIAKEISS